RSSSPPAASADEHSSPAPDTKDDLGELVSAAAAGDGDAAATLIVHLGGSILRVVRKVMGRDHADVDDVAQDAVIGFLDALGKFRGECGVARLARRVALRTGRAAGRRTRQRSRWSEAQEPDLVGSGPEEPASPLATTLASRRRALVLQLLDELPDVFA